MNDDCIYHILSFVPANEEGNLIFVCKSWYEALRRKRNLRNEKKWATRIELQCVDVSHLKWVIDHGTIDHINFKFVTRAVQSHDLPTLLQLKSYRIDNLASCIFITAVLERDFGFFKWAVDAGFPRGVETYQHIAQENLLLFMEYLHSVAKCDNANIISTAITSDSMDVLKFLLAKNYPVDVVAYDLAGTKYVDLLPKWTKFTSNYIKFRSSFFSRNGDLMWSMFPFAAWEYNISVYKGCVKYEHEHVRLNGFYKQCKTGVTFRLKKNILNDFY